ncbi:class I SAM-dependent methyltransferase [bacterium]|nr:class I SAM-dependent methyltransferase [bacterium]
MNFFNNSIKNFLLTKDNILVNKIINRENKSTKKIFKIRFEKFKKKSVVLTQKRYDQFWVKNFDKKKIFRSINKSNLILDCGVGAGNMSFNILKKINIKDKEYIANDINLENLRKLKNNYQKFFPKKKQLICCQFDKIPLKKNTVDLVLSVGSLHHDRKPLFSLNKICSFLKKNGEIILWVYKTPPLIRVITDNYFRNKIQQEKKFNKVKDLLIDLTKLGYFLKKNNSDIYINENLKSLEIKKGKFKIQEFIFNYFLRNTYNKHLEFEYSFYENLDWFAPKNNFTFKQIELEKFFKKNKMHITFFRETQSGLSFIAKKI